MENFRAKIEKEFVDEEIIPSEVWDAATQIGEKLKNEHQCEIFAEVDNLNVKIHIKTGIVIHATIDALTEDLDLSKVHLVYNATRRFFLVSSALLQ